MNVYKRKVRKTRKRFFNYEGVEAYIGDLSKNTEIFGITKGQFSIIDIIEYVLNHTGKANVMIATWTAAQADIKKAFEFLQSDKIQDIKFIVDRGFVNRQKEYCNELIEKFGDDSIRFLRIHAKFIVIQNDEYNFVIRTSMNLNENKRFENFEITEDLEFCEYFKDFFNITFNSVQKNDFSGNINVVDALDKKEKTEDEKEFEQINFDFA